MVKPISKDARIAALEVENWNLKYPVGTPVRLHKDSGEVLETKTRYPAYVGDAGYAICFFEGVSGYYLLDRATPLDEAAVGSTVKQIRQNGGLGL